MSSLLDYLLSHGMGRALRHANYARFVGWGFVSTMGFWVQRLGMQWLVWDLTHSYFWLGAVALTEAAIVIAFLPAAGALADRVDRLFIARATQSASMAIAAVLGVATLAGLATPLLLLVFVALMALADAFWTPVRLALVPNLLPREDLMPAMGLLAFSFNTSQMLGPALAGFILLYTDVGYAFLFNALSYAFMVMALFRITIRPSGLAPRQSAGFFADFRAGLGYVARHRLVLALLMLSASVSFLVRPYRELLAGYADDLFGRGASGLSALASATGAGALIAAIIASGLLKSPRSLKPIFIALCLIVLGLLMFVIAPQIDFGVAVAASATVGFLATFIAIQGQVLLQSIIPEDRRGRVMALWGAQMRAGPPLGAWLVSIVAGAWSMPMALALMAALLTVFIAWSAMWTRR
ncbi:MAG: MFS transporter [Sphingomonadales bacterium]